jgi:hypothetical protein
MTTMITTTMTITTMTITTVENFTFIDESMTTAATMSLALNFTLIAVLPLLTQRVDGANLPYPSDYAETSSKCYQFSPSCFSAKPNFKKQKFGNWRIFAF